jgi:hypothetical protein
MADYTYWQNALAGNFGPVHDGDPQPGFYRKRTGKAAGYVPVAIWDDGAGGMECLVDRKESDANEVWTYCCPHPITEEQYHQRVNTGKWHDEDAAVTASLSPPPAGHNQPDGVDSIKDQIESALAGVDGYAEVKDDETAAKAQSLRSRLLELSRDADKQREALKRPHFEAGKAVDELYQPLVKSAKGGADAIAKALGAHETRKAQEAAKATRLAEEARQKALAEAQAKAPIGVTVEPEPIPELVVPPAAAPIRGAYGRAASVKVVKIATVKDQDAAYQALKSQPELSALIQKLAQKLVDAGFSVAGVEIEEQRKVS